jgi:hypothetical protein
MAEADTIEAGEAEAETATTRSQMEKHEGFVQWYNDEVAEDGAELHNFEPSVVIAEFARLRNEFRRSDFYLSQWGPEAREKARVAKEEATEQKRAEREIERQRKAAERAAAKEKAEKEAAESGEEGATKSKPKTRRKVAKKAAPSTIEVDETEAGEEAGEDEVFD